MENKQKEKDLLTIEELMDFLPDKPLKNTVYAWTTRGLIPFVKIGRKLFFKKDEIIKWNENRIKETV